MILSEKTDQVTVSKSLKSKSLESNSLKVKKRLPGETRQPSTTYLNPELDSP